MWPFKRRRPSEGAAEEDYPGTFAAYADFIASAELDPLALYDTSNLPRPKDKIRDALFAFYIASQTRDLRDAVRASLHMLASFQDGVGAAPLHKLGMALGDVRLPQGAGEAEIRAMAKRISEGASSVGSRYAELDSQREREVQISEAACLALDQKYPLKG